MSVVRIALCCVKQLGSTETPRPTQSRVLVPVVGRTVPVSRDCAKLTQNRTLSGLALAIGFALFATPAQSDEIHLRDGHSLTGNILMVQSDSYVFRDNSPASGMQTIPKTAVRTVFYDDPAQADRVLGIRAALRLTEGDPSFVRLLPTVEPGRRLLPFTLGVARRVALEQARRRRRGGDGHGGEAELAAVVAPGPALVDAAARSEEQARVIAALADLEPEQRSVVTLRFVSGLVMEELAAAIGCSVPTARARLREASARLVVALEARGLVRDAAPAGGVA